MWNLYLHLHLQLGTLLELLSLGIAWLQGPNEASI